MRAEPRCRLDWGVDPLVVGDEVSRVEHGAKRRITPGQGVLDRSSHLTAGDANPDLAYQAACARKYGRT